MKNNNSKLHTGNGQEAGNFLWNSIGGMLNAGQSVLILMVITRVCGLDAAGIFSIAFATGNLFLYLGNYGVRNYQVSDLKEQYAFRDYLRHRCLTVLLMVLVSLLYVGYSLQSGRYSAYKSMTVLAMCLLKAVDCMEEVFEGRLQQKGRLDRAGKLMTARLVVSIGGMLVVLLITKDLLTSTLAAIVLAILTVIVVLWFYRDTLELRRGRVSGAAMKGLMTACFPVCAANFLSFYLTNAPKYAIDAVMSESVQAQYNFIAMPVFVIQLLNMFMYQPALVKMTAAWNAKDNRGFLRMIGKILLGLAGVSVLVLAGAWVLGIPVLSLLYATDLSALKTEMMLILCAGIFLAVDGFLCAVLTIARAQNRIPLAYLAGTALSLILTNRMTAAGGIRGAVTAYLLIMILVMLLLSGLFAAALRKNSG